MPKFPDVAYCTLTLAYKSKARHVFDTTVKQARETVQRQIDRKALVFAKVTIPDPNSNRLAILMWEPTGGWVKNVVEVKTKDS